MYSRRVIDLVIRDFADREDRYGNKIGFDSHPARALGS